jgi:hypothetical protein
MSYNPYLDTDWTQVSPEVSHLLWLSDEELKIAKKRVGDRASKVLKLSPNQETRKTA